jgi:hypothetical protein
MVKRSRNGNCLKVVSAAVACIFLWNQISWAAELLLPPDAAEPQTSASMTAPDLISGQEAKGSLIESRNAIENFVPCSHQLSPHGLEYDLIKTNAGGWTYYYDGDLIREQTAEDGRAYVYREYYDFGPVKTREYYAPGGAHLWTEIKYYAQDNSFSGRKLEYSDGRLHIQDGEKRDIRVNYPDGRYVLYERFHDGRIKTEFSYSSGDVFEHMKEYFYDGSGAGNGYRSSLFTGESYEYDRQGRLAKMILPDGDFYVYEEWDHFGRSNAREYYSADSSFCWRREDRHDDDGAFRGVTIFYPDGMICHKNRYFQDERVTYPNGDTIVYERYPEGRMDREIYYEQDGGVIYEQSYLYDTKGFREGYVRVYTSGKIVHYGAEGRINRIEVGSRQEQRKYVISEQDVVYTFALIDGNVTSVEEGYNGSDAFMSGMDGNVQAEAISVTYADGITMDYAGKDLRALFVEDGFVNFYSGNNIEKQNSSKGDLYIFQENFVKQAVTTTGNIYNFGIVRHGSGVSVTIEDAVINGKRCKFSGSFPAAVYKEGITVNILDLAINNRSDIDHMVIERGNGEEYLDPEDPFVEEVADMLKKMREDIPNIKLEYAPDISIIGVLTSGYGKILLRNGLISGTVSAEGNEVFYDYMYENGTITGVKLTEEGVIRAFDSKGDLVRVEFQDEETIGTINFDDGELSSLSSLGAILREITFDGSGGIDAARLLGDDGEEYFFQGGRLESFTGGNVEYQLDASGAVSVIRRIDHGETFDVKYGGLSGDEGDGQIVFTSREKGTKYLYEDEALKSVLDPSGMRVDYGYDDLGRTSGMEISHGGARNTLYGYEYTEGGTRITDDLGNVRIFDGNNRAVELKTSYGELYSYMYDTDVEGDPITIVNYTRKEMDDGAAVEYFRGQIQRIDKPDGSWIDNVEFDRFSGQLSRFSLHTACGKHHNVILEGKYIQFEMEDSTRLIFYENTLVAFAGSQGIVRLYDADIGDLENIIYSRDRSQMTPVAGEGIDMAFSSWRHQTYEDSQAVNFVERDHLAGQWEISLDIEADDPRRSQGEMYLDLRYDIPGLEWQAPVDMRGREISFMFKLDDRFEYAHGDLSEIQVFAKDSEWNTQYGSKVAMSGTGWMKVSLIPTDDNINFGYTDPGFDPSRITMIGLRIKAPDNSVSGARYRGKVFLKHDILPDLFENVNAEVSPLDGLYRSLGILRDLDRFNGSVAKETAMEGVLELFSEALAGGASNVFQENLLRQISWHPETEASGIKGVKSVYRDTDSDELVLEVDLSSSGKTSKEGEIYFDIDRDVPGLNWGSAANLAGRTVRMLVKIPSGLVGASDSPNGARLFVEDADMKMQYGTWINLKEEGKWYQLEITPTFGAIPMGFTQEGFDASKIRRIGLNISTQDHSCTDFQGEIRVKFPERETDNDPMPPVSMPLWMDLRGIKDYLVDENDNYIKVPKASYLSEEYYSYVFNQGSGREPTEDLSVIEKCNTVWKQELGGVSSVSWNSRGDALIADLDITSGKTRGDVYLDLRYGCYVPDKNWNGPLDLSRKEISFYVRSADGFISDASAPFTIEAFAKDDPGWRAEYSEKVYVDASGEWKKVTLIPSPVDFNSGYVDHRGFDPTEVICLGLRFSSLDPAHEHRGPVEIRYEVNDVHLGLHGVGHNDVLPAHPVWVDQRELAKYLADEAIGLYSDFSLMQRIKCITKEIPSYRLPSDLAAATVFDKDNKIVSISKPDGTISYFDGENRVDRVVFEDGSVFMDYEYDDEGRLVNSFMPAARERLLSSMADAEAEVEKVTADTLLILAEQKKLLTENYMRDVIAQRAQFAAARASLESQRYVEIKRRFLWWTWTEKIERPGINEAIADVNRQEAEFNRLVAEELAGLDAEVSAKKNEISTERDLVLSGYRWQEKKMLLEVLHEESIPVIYYYYRNILGRDATESEIEAILRRIDSNNGFAGFLERDIIDPETLILALKSERLEWVYSGLSRESRIFVDSYPVGETTDRDGIHALIGDLDIMVRTYDLYSLMSSHYGTDALSDMLTEKTKIYRDGLVSDGIPSEEIDDDQKNRLEWLNRYVLQDILPGLAAKDKDSPYFDAASLRGELSVSEEHLSSITFKGSVIARIKVFFDRYFDGVTEPDTLLEYVGLTGTDIMDIDEGYLASLYSWLEGQDLHFGRSAFGTLKKMLDSRGVDASMEEVAGKALLADILLGITGPLTDKSIRISMFGMERVARSYGLNAVSARLDYGQIMLAGAPFVTLINGDHYITVTSVTDSEVTYWEQNAGEYGDEVKIDRRDFEDKWQGNVITDAVPDPGTILSGAAARKIKGACFGVLIAAVAGIFMGIGAAVSMVIEAIGLITLTLTSLVGQIGAFLVEGLVGLGNILGFAGRTFLGALGLGSSSGIPGTVSGFSLSTLIEGGSASALVRIGSGYVSSIALEAMGVDPIVSGIVSSAITGGISGLLGPDASFGLAFRSAIQWGGAAGANMLGNYFDVSPLITRILSISTAAFSGAALHEGISFSEAIGGLSKDIVGELAYYGVNFAGGALGLRNDVSHLAGIGIRSSLQAGLGTFGSGGNPLGFMWDAFKETIKIEIPYLLLDQASSAMGIDPAITYQLAPVIERILAPVFERRDLFEGVCASMGFGSELISNAIKMVFGGIAANLGNIGPDNFWKGAIYLENAYNSGNADLEGLKNIWSEDEVRAYNDSLMLFGGGFWNESNEGEMSSIMRSYMSDLVADGIISPERAFGITTFERTDSFSGTIENMLGWGLNSLVNGYNPITDEITAEIDAFLGALTEEQANNQICYFSHSGHFCPLVKALNMNAEYRIDTLIVYEGPFIGEQVIDNPNLSRIINVRGTGAPNIENPYELIKWGPQGLYLDPAAAEFSESYVPFLGNVNFAASDGRQIENFNFEIIGARHSDFSYDPDNTNLTPEQREINIATNYFMRQLARSAADTFEWSNLISSTAINYDENSKVYVVDSVMFFQEKNND